MGYAGGTLKDPTYHNLGDHTESVQIDFDPEEVSFSELLEVFWSSHDPTQKASSRQYISILFYHNESQKQKIIESISEEEKKLGRVILTEVIPFSEFYLAEGYHQKYRLKMFREFMDDYSKIFLSDRELTDSTAAARLNGYVSGMGDLLQLDSEIDLLGLSPAAQDKLRKMVSASE